MIIYEKAVFCEHVADFRPSLHQEAAPVPGAGLVWFYFLYSRAAFDSTAELMQGRLFRPSQTKSPTAPHWGLSHRCRRPTAGAVPVIISNNTPSPRFLGFWAFANRTPAAIMQRNSPGAIRSVWFISSSTASRWNRPPPAVPMKQRAARLAGTDQARK